MGILKQGIFGKVTGKVGNLVSYELLGQQVIRVAGRNTHPASKGQRGCRKDMASVMAFLKPITEFIKVGYLLAAKRANLYPHNLAVSYLMKNALTGTYPDVELDYTKVMVAQGRLPRAINPVVELVAEGLKFSWELPPGMEWQEGRHQVMLLAYFPLLGKAVHVINGAHRSTGTDVLRLSKAIRGQCAETYISFISIPDNEVADSVYSGGINSGAFI